MTVDVTVLGGGVCGLAVAAEAAARGAAVAVLDPAGAPGPHACSWWAGGMLAPDCEAVTAEPPVARLGREAAGWWADHGAEVVHAGSLVVALGRDRADLRAFEARAEGARRLDRDALAALEPDLADRVDAALLMEREAHLDPRAALTTLRARLEAQGVTFAADAAAPQGRVVDCRGLAARDRLPDLRGVRGEMVVLRTRDIRLTRPVRLLHPRFPLYVVPRGDGLFMLGATQIESDARGPATVRSVMELLNAAYALHPAFAEAELVEIGADARPAFPDNLPRLRWVDGTLHANGLFRHGFLLAPALARRAAAWLLDDAPPEDFHDRDR